MRRTYENLEALKEEFENEIEIGFNFFNILHFVSNKGEEIELVADATNGYTLLYEDTKEVILKHLITSKTFFDEAKTFLMQN